MKIIRHAMVLLVLSIGTFTGSTLATDFPAPMPQFMNREQLAKWRVEQAVDPAASRTGINQPERIKQFYTGRPFVLDLGSYLFKYRSYDPELARWTSVDSSGFPDGPNAYSYINNEVVASIDYGGLNGIKLVGDSQVKDFNSLPQDDIQLHASMESSTPPGVRVPQATVSFFADADYGKISRSLVNQGPDGPELWGFQFRVFYTSQGTIGVEPDGTYETPAGGSDLQIVTAAAIDRSAGDKVVTIIVQTVALYKASGINGGGLSFPSGAGVNLSWQKADKSSAKGTLAMSFEE